MSYSWIEGAAGCPSCHNTDAHRWDCPTRDTTCSDCGVECHASDRDGSHHEKWCRDWTPSESSIAAYVDSHLLDY